MTDTGIVKPFLFEVAEALYQQHRHDLYTLAVVFPNRRQSVFFQHYLRQIAASPFVMPELLTIEELVKRSAALPIADTLVQSFSLYEAFAQISRECGDGADSIPDFDTFYGIGETLLKDFREIDNYLADVGQVYHVLQNVEAIDKLFDYLTEEQRNFLRSFWAGTIQKSAVQEKFLKLWQRLPAIYQRFYALLAAQQCTTLGMAYRQLGNGEPSRAAFASGWSHVAFVGFNAFNRAEETLLQRWQGQGFCSLWMDADVYYTGNPGQEAGFFLRRNLQQLKLQSSMPLIESIGHRDRPVQVTAVQGHTAQAKLVASWLSQLPAAGNPFSAGILLADETLLLPVLQSLPAGAQPVNVTMGYPLQQSAIFSYLQLFFAIHQDMQAHRNLTVYHLHVEAWLNHPLCDWPPEAVEKLKDDLVKKIMLRVPVKLLTRHTPMASELFSPLKADLECFERLRTLLEAMMKLPAVQQDALLQGAAGAAWQAVQQVAPMFGRLSPSPNLAFIGSMLRRQFAGISVPFEGEPLQGIQVMGLLESRGLDFDHLLVLGAGEGALPRVKAPDTFLPDNVRRAFGLPVLEHQDAIFAYVFYRLLHRCQHLHLVYNALVTDNSTGEVSRFVQQLDFETQIPFVYHRPGMQVSPQAFPAISIPRSKEISKKLFMYWGAEKPITLSPSAINTWLNCRLQFFLKYIAGLKEQQKLTDGVDAAVFGSIVHKLMERLYAALLAYQGHGQITAGSIAWMRGRIEEETEPAFREAWRETADGEAFVFTGELLVIREVVQQYAQGFLDEDEKQVPFTLHDLEVKFAQPFPLRVEGKTVRVILGGYIDRVDEKDGVFRMLDYKTGGDSPEFKHLEGLFERDGRGQNKAALQTLLYSWMFSQKYPDRKRFEPALVALRTLQKNQGASTRLFEKANKRPIDAEHIPEALNEVASRLRTLLEELFDSSSSFDQTAEIQHCTYCDFKAICGR